MSELYHTFRDGESVEYWDPVLSFVQGSLAAERQKSTGRFARDSKEFKTVSRLNRQNRLSLYEILKGTESEESSDGKVTGIALIEKTMSGLGASYPELPGLGIYITGLGQLEGKNQGKKLFSLLHYFSQYPEMESSWKFLILEPIAKLILNLTAKGKWFERTQLLLSCMGMNAFAAELAIEILNGNPSAIRDSLELGEKLSKVISIQFYQNTRMYKSKVRRRGYARSSPSRPGNSIKAVQAANSSPEYLLGKGYLKKSSEGGYDMNEKTESVQDLIFKIFTNSLEAFEAAQQEIKERKKKTDQKPPDYLHDSDGIQSGENT